MRPVAGCGSLLGIFDAHTVIELNFYCDAMAWTPSRWKATGFAMDASSSG